jgi:hypothetical protein
MSLNLICIYSGGALTLLMALFPAQLPRRFNRPAGIPKLSPLNRRIFFTIGPVWLLFLALA